jgi:broad specificity phosphatase PhoE
MGAIYLVRHGQASFGTDDYDRLSETGFAQARLLGAYFSLRKIRFDALYTGTLRRHAETAQGILDGGSAYGEGLAVTRFPGLDEYDSEALIMALKSTLPAPVTAASRRDSAVVREHFRVLRDALLAWAEDRLQPAGMPAFKAFQEGAVAAIDEARRLFADGNVLVVSSGGPIAAIVAAALQAPPKTAVELNLRIRNSSVTEFALSVRRHQLVSFNALPHLDTQPDPALITYA